MKQKLMKVISVIMVFTLFASCLIPVASAANDGFTLTFDSNGGEDWEQIVWKNKSYCGMLNMYPNREGYICLGWSPDEAATTAEYLHGDYISLSEDTVLYAVWAPVPTLELVNNPGTVTLSYGDKLIVTAKTSELPEGIALEWTSTSIKTYNEGNTCQVTAKKNDTPVSVSARLIYEKNKEIVRYNGVQMYASQVVEFDFSFWAKFVSFFKDLFGVNRVIYQ